MNRQFEYIFSFKLYWICFGWVLRRSRVCVIVFWQLKKAYWPHRWTPGVMGGGWVGGWTLTRKSSKNLSKKWLWVLWYFYYQVSWKCSCEGPVLYLLTPIWHITHSSSRTQNIGPSLMKRPKSSLPLDFKPVCIKVLLANHYLFAYSWLETNLTANECNENKSDTNWMFSQ